MAENPERTGGPRAGVPESRGQDLYLTLLGRPIRALPVVNLAASRVLLGRPAILCGWSLSPGAGGAAIFDIFDGGDATGELVASGAVGANTPWVAGLSPDGPLLRIGLFLQISAGTARGAIWVKV